MPIVIEPKNKPPTERKEKMAKNTKLAGNAALLAKAMKLARSRKKSGRLNKDDLSAASKFVKRRKQLGLKIKPKKKPKKP